jgi:hypothetical protein
MIWHIFKKDLQLLWPFALLAAVIHGLNAATVYLSGGIDRLYVSTVVLSVLSILGLIILVASVVHQDTVPGVRQDWLIRPIRRRDLIAAKLLFVLVMGLSPLYAADVALGLADKFPLGATLAASLMRSAALLCLICLPTLIVAAVTRTLQEFVVILAVAVVAFWVLRVLLAVMGVHSPLAGTGLTWITTSVWTGLSVLAALTLLPMQYVHRRGLTIRWLSGGFLVCALMATAIPWKLAFAIQKSLSPEPGSGASVAIEYNSTDSASLSRMAPSLLHPDSARIRFKIVVKGLPADSALVADQYAIRVLNTQGTILYQGASNFPKASQPVAGLALRHGDEEQEQFLLDQSIDIPSHVIAWKSAQAVRVEIDYSLTLMRSVAQDWFATVENDESLAGFGRCTIRPDDRAVDLNCLSTRPLSGCIAGYTGRRATGKKTWLFMDCNSRDYAPFAGAIWRDAYFRLGLFGTGQSFDSTGDAGVLSNMVEMFIPQDHFTRHLTIPKLQLP